MTDGLLENIIQLEKHIQAEVASEQARASEWQSRELTELHQAMSKAREKEKQRCQQQLAEKKAELLNEGTAMEAAADAWCQRLASLDEAILRDALKRYLAAILPGGDHDHPHGQG